MMKKRYLAIPILAIALHFLLSNLLYFLVERLVLDIFHIPPQQFMKHSYWGEILVYAVLILVFFTLYKLLWRKDISEPRTATNFKDVLGTHSYHKLRIFCISKDFQNHINKNIHSDKSHGYK